MYNNSTSSIVVGSDYLQTSTAGTEINTNGKRLINFSFYNDQICHVKINNGEYIYLRANQGCEIDVLFSFKIQESGITFNWIGTEW